MKNQELLNKIPEALDLLILMTYLTKLKYGNSDEDIFAKIERAEELLEELKPLRKKKDEKPQK